MNPLNRLATATAIACALAACVGVESIAPALVDGDSSWDTSRWIGGGSDAGRTDLRTGAPDDDSPVADTPGALDALDALESVASDEDASAVGVDADDRSDHDGGAMDILEPGRACGDGTVDEDEECDDGNTDDGDGCASDCTNSGLDLCAPCDSDDECGGPGDLCVELRGERFCGRDCSRGDCAPGYVCRAIADDGVIVARQCRPLTGGCASLCPDADDDDVCDADDVCAGGDDRVDENDDGVPDACEVEPDPELCDDGEDNDVDGAVDCDDSDCRADAVCLSLEVCGDGLDNEGDGLTDCADPDCAEHASCPQPEICDNGRDDDFDARLDCDDNDCALDPACAVSEICDNGRDDDLDGSIDCEDSDCSFDPVCPRPEVCNNGRDDDLDGQTDCADLDCERNLLCAVPEVCDNGHDDDIDGFTDCDDLDCSSHLACRRPTGDRCDDPFVLGGYGTFTGNTSDFVADYAGSCRTGGGGRDLVYRFTAPDSGAMCAHTVGSSFDTVLYVQTVCGDSGTDIGCDDDGGGSLTSEVDFTASAGSTYFFIIDGFSSASAGDYSFTIRRGPCDLPAGEVCEETLIATFGTYTGSTATSLHDYSGSCQSSTAPDVVYAFTPPSSGSVCIDTFGSTYDTLIYAQTTCGDSATDVGCDDDTSGLQSQIEIGGVGGQTYYVVVDGYSTSSGDYTLNIRDGTCDAGAGDTCSGVEITGFGTFDGTTAGLVDDFRGGCTTAAAPDRVYRFRSPVTGPICANTVGSGYDTVVHVRTSCADSLSEIACNDDTFGLQSQVQFDAGADTTYYIIIDGWSTSSSGDYTLNLSNGACP